ncbi:MAG: hypothetical protein ACD_62C00624G0004, partial [uncultured bacterium]
MQMVFIKWGVYDIKVGNFDFA